METMKPCILRILADILFHQAQMAEILSDQSVLDLSHRKKLREEIQRNHADFKRLVPEFQLQIEPRKDRPRRNP